MLAANHTNAISTMVAPAAVRAQFWAEMISPGIADAILTTRAHQNIAPADLAMFLAAAAGTISMAVTMKTPTALTENTTIKASSAAKIYW